MKQPKGEILSALVKTRYAPQPCHVSFKVDPKAKRWPLGLLQARYACIVIVEHQCIWTLKQRNRFSLSSSLVYCAACHVIFMSGCFVYHEQLLTTVWVRLWAGSICHQHSSGRQTCGPKPTGHCSSSSFYFGCVSLWLVAHESVACGSLTERQ